MEQYQLLQLKEYNQRVKKHLPGGVHYNFRLPWEETPIHFKDSRESRLWDLDGNEYLDLYARFGASILGHCHSEYSERLKQMIDRTLSVSHCEIDAEVLEVLNQHMPSAEMVRFGVSGTEIVQNALRLARAYTKKNRFIRFEGHYHGNADNIMGGKSRNSLNPTPSDYVGDLRGTDGRARNALEDQSFLLPWNDEARLEAVIEKYADEIAAVITEPICINGGGIMPLPGYLEKMRALCDKYHIVLIFDEIITGFRMGLGGAQKTLGVTPDLTTLGKAIAGGGVPVAALVGKKKIMQLLVEKKVIHAGTFNGYPLGTAAILSTCEILGRNNSEALRQMEVRSTQLHQIFLELASEIGFPLVIQGPPSCASYHCTDKPLAQAGDLTYDMMFKDILLNNSLSRFGVLVSTVSRMYPNVSLKDSDLNFFRERAAHGLADAKQNFAEIFGES